VYLDREALVATLHHRQVDEVEEQDTFGPAEKRLDEQGCEDHMEGIARSEMAADGRSAAHAGCITAEQLSQVEHLPVQQGSPRQLVSAL